MMSYHGALVVTLRTCYGALQIVVLLLNCNHNVTKNLAGALVSGTLSCGPALGAPFY